MRNGGGGGAGELSESERWSVDVPFFQDRDGGGSGLEGRHWLNERKADGLGAGHEG